jgi:hypothetical protein
MPTGKINTHREDLELISNHDLVASAHAILGGIQLDVASSKVANSYVEAENYLTPMDDSLNEVEWEADNVYLFPPSGKYFLDKKTDRWKKTRAYAGHLVSSHAVWWRKLYKTWLDRKVRHALYFSNCPDMIRYEQKIFDFPVCILRTIPKLVKNTSEGIGLHHTCTSFAVYLPPQDDPTPATENFIELYSEKGRVLC